MLRYVDNPNGSVDDIAGVCNAGRNVVGLMPHPERASDPLLGSEDGVVLLEALLRTAGAPPSADPARARLTPGTVRRSSPAAGDGGGPPEPGRLSSASGGSWPAGAPRR